MQKINVMEEIIASPKLVEVATSKKEDIKLRNQRIK